MENGEQQTVSPMTMVDVKSSQFDKVGYDPATRKMRILFKRNALYEYDNVDPQVYADLMSAESKGSYFINNIKKAGFAYRRLPGEGETQVS